ncbi:MAG TPA: hypothetical protein VFH68_15740 [Polyangia bacterium]|nr:hypothetical protein [Polyangia bacterium]
MSTANMRIALSLLVLGLACTRANPLYQGPVTDSGDDVPSDGSIAADARADVAPDGGGRESGGDTARDAITDANPDNPLACVLASDCALRNGGAPPCGAWECRGRTCAVICPDCTDLDHDGFGVGSGCAGADCDDANFAIRATVPARSCYSGANNTMNVGACRAGWQSCAAGVWTACVGQILPTTEACNGEDDNCDGTVDNFPDTLSTVHCGLGACARSVPACAAGVVGACLPLPPAVDDECDNVDNDCDGQVDENCPADRDSCVHVAPDGDDLLGEGTVAAPYQTLSVAMLAAAVPPVRPVCVAAGSDCDARSTYSLPAVFVMANGVSVHGNYESSAWLPCPINPAAPDPHVTLQLGGPLGVQFPATVTLPTALDGFVLQRAAAAPGAMASTAGVTVNGAKKVLLSNLVINDRPQAPRSWGVNLINGGEALITHCNIAGGAGTMENIGVRSVASFPTLRENCAALDATTGRCSSTCTPPPPVGISGRTDNGTVGPSTAVYLEASPGALVETSTLCASVGEAATGVRILGNAAGTVVRGNTISAVAGETASRGVWAEDCVQASPWIVGNQLIEAEGGTRAMGVVAVGDCDPVIDSNRLISANGDGSTMQAHGVACQINGFGEPSLCAVLGNALIQGSANFNPAVSAGVSCGEGSCARVAGNVVVGNQGQSVIGVWLRNDGVTVERNQITGGCGQDDASGILADDSFSRVQNNLVTGGACPSGVSPSSVGVRVYNNLDQNEIDIHSNTIDGGGNSGRGDCVSAGIEWDIGPETAPTAPKGIVRNNILRPGLCSDRTDFSERLSSTDPRVFENNDLDPTTGNTVLYLNEALIPLREISAVNALADTTVRNNISADPRFVGFPTNQHLMTGSPCVGAGTSAGAPAADLDGKPRSPLRPTIGAYE